MQKDIHEDITQMDQAPSYLHRTVWLDTYLSKENGCCSYARQQIPLKCSPANRETQESIAARGMTYVAQPTSKKTTHNLHKVKVKVRLGCPCA